MYQPGEKHHYQTSYDTGVIRARTGTNGVLKDRGAIRHCPLPGTNQYPGANYA